MTDTTTRTTDDIHADLASRRQAREGITPGPWRWELNLKSKKLQLCGGKPKYDLTVMDFVRWGMSGAVCRFIVDGLMHKAYEFAQVVKGREHHASWFQTIDHPDAAFIASAPAALERADADIEVLLDENERLREENRQSRQYLRSMLMSFSNEPKRHAFFMVYNGRISCKEGDEIASYVEGLEARALLEVEK